MRPRPQRQSAIAEEYLSAVRAGRETELRWRGEDEERLVVHCTDPETAESVLAAGVLLSAVELTGRPGEELSADSLFHDPPDYFHFVMFGVAHLRAGENVVASKKAGVFVDAAGASERTPVARFYFGFENLARHPGAEFDGLHIVKIRDRLELAPHLHRVELPGG